MTLQFPKPVPHNNNKDFQAKKKDIAAYLSSHVQPNHNTTLTLSDQTGKSIIIKCNTDNPAHLLDIAMTYLSN